MKEKREGERGNEIDRWFMGGSSRRDRERCIVRLNHLQSQHTQRGTVERLHEWAGLYGVEWG